MVLVVGSESTLDKLLIVFHYWFYGCCFGGVCRMEISFPQDAVVESVLCRIVKRAEAGMETYGKPMTRSDLTMNQWLDNAIEEALDFALYLTKIKGDMGEFERDTYRDGKEYGYDQGYKDGYDRGADDAYKDALGG